jgi:two-component system response regulator VicR
VKNILVIDDEQITRSLIEMSLQVNGYNVFTANSANEGLELFKNTEFSLVITDVLMPDKTGVDLIPELLEIKKVPIIAISGGRRKTFNSDFILDSARESGATIGLKKPVSPNLLIQSVLKLLA